MGGGRGVFATTATTNPTRQVIRSDTFAKNLELLAGWVDDGTVLLLDQSRIAVQLRLHLGNKGQNAVRGQLGLHLPLRIHQHQAIAMAIEQCDLFHTGRREVVDNSVGKNGERFDLRVLQIVREDLRGDTEFLCEAGGSNGTRNRNSIAVARVTGRMASILAGKRESYRIGHR